VDKSGLLLEKGYMPEASLSQRDLFEAGSSTASSAEPQLSIQNE